MRSPRRLSRRADVTRHPSLGGLPRPCAIARLTHDSAPGSLPPLPNRCRTPDTADTHRRRRSRDCRYAGLCPVGRRFRHAVVEPRWRSPEAAGKRRLRPGHSRRGAARYQRLRAVQTLVPFLRGAGDFPHRTQRGNRPCGGPGNRRRRLRGQTLQPARTGASWRRPQPRWALGSRRMGSATRIPPSVSSRSTQATRFDAGA